MSLSFSSAVVPHSASCFLSVFSVPYLDKLQFRWKLWLFLRQTDKNETRIIFCFLTVNMVGREIIIRSGRGTFRETVEWKIGELLIWPSKIDKQLHAVSFRKGEDHQWDTSYHGDIWIRFFFFFFFAVPRGLRDLSSVLLLLSRISCVQLRTTP